MALSVSKTGNAVAVTFDGSTDFEWATDSTVDMADGCQLIGMVWMAAAAGGVMTVRDETTTGTILLPISCDIAVNGAYNFPVIFNTKPVVKGSEVTNGMKAVFYFEEPL